MVSDVSAKSPQTANEHGFSRFSKTFYGPLTFSEAVCVDGKILRVVPLFLTLFLPFTERVSPGLGLKREQKPTVRLFGTGEMLAKVPLTVLSSYKAADLNTPPTAMTMNTSRSRMGPTLVFVFCSTNT